MSTINFGAERAKALSAQNRTECDSIDIIGLGHMSYNAITWKQKKK